LQQLDNATRNKKKWLKMFVRNGTNYFPEEQLSVSLIMLIAPHSWIANILNTQEVQKNAGAKCR
jgi:hypothetical protein